MRRVRSSVMAKAAVSLSVQTFRKLSENKLLQLSAALAYYAMFSIGPLLVITVGVAGLAYGHETVRGQIDHQLQGLFGKDAAKTLDSMMTAHRSGKTALTTIAGIVALVFGATGVFAQLQYSMNSIWSVKADPKSGIWNLIRTRFLSLGMVLGTGFLLLISLVLTTVLAALAGRWGAGMNVPPALIHGINAVISFVVIAALFAMIFKFLPDVVIPFSKVWIGAVGTAFLFEAGKFGLSYYVGREGFTSSYGAAGAVIALLVWVYYGSLILFLGAQFTQVWFTRVSGPPKVSPHAVAVESPKAASRQMRRRSV